MLSCLVPFDRSIDVICAWFGNDVSFLTISHFRACPASDHLSLLLLCFHPAACARCSQFGWLWRAFAHRTASPVRMTAICWSIRTRSWPARLCSISWSRQFSLLSDIPIWLPMLEVGVFLFCFFFLYKSVYRSLISDELYRNFYNLKPLPTFSPTLCFMPFYFRIAIIKSSIHLLPCCFIVFHHLFVPALLQSVIVIVDLSSAFSSREPVMAWAAYVPFPRLPFRLHSPFLILLTAFFFPPFRFRCAIVVKSSRDAIERNSE